MDALEQDRTLLLRLVESIRDENQEDAARLLNLIRSDASLDEIRQFLTQDSPLREGEHVQQPVRGPSRFCVRKYFILVASCSNTL